jgi:hypothetical protein
MLGINLQHALNEENMRNVVYMLLLSLIPSCSLMRNNPDSFPEEVVEQWIDQATGFDIDFTSADGQ